METSYVRPEDKGLGTRDVLRILQDYWKGIVLFVILGTLITLGWSLIQPKVYQSTATGLVVATGSTDMASSYAGDNLAKSKAISYGALSTSRPIIDEIISNLDLEISGQELLSNMTVITPEDSAQVLITVGAENPGRAAVLADAWLATLGEQVEEIENMASFGDASVRLLPLGKAPIPTEPVAPDILFNVVLGAVTGLLLGVLYALVRHRVK